jgi:hypothetical protein
LTGRAFSLRWPAGRRLLAAAVAALVYAAAPACAARRSSTESPLHAEASKVPVVLIPGIGGSKLRDRADGRIRWGRARDALFPRDGGYGVARPVSPPADWVDPIEPFDVMRRIRFLGLFAVDVYAGLIRFMQANGYRAGDLWGADPGEDFFVFPYDLRYDNFEVTRQLADGLRALRDARGGELRVNLICHSNATHIARFFVKYGDASLDEAERGVDRRLPGIRVEKLILVGPANGGAFATFEALDRGRRYVPWVGRRFRPETVFTLRSLYGNLPAYDESLFIDERGNPLAVDVFDPESWRRYGWSVFAEKVRRRLQKQDRPDLFGDEEERLALLGRMLDQARRMYDLLLRDVPGFATRYYMIQNVSRRTTKRAVIVEDANGYETLLPGDRGVSKRDHLADLLLGEGDGLATRESQTFLSPQEKAAIAGGTDRIRTRHRKLIQDPETRRLILEYLTQDEAP